MLEENPFHKLYNCEQEFSGMLKENPFHKLYICIQSPKQLLRTIPGQIVHDLLQVTYDLGWHGNSNLRKQASNVGWIRT